MALRPCSECKKWVYNKDGSIQKYADGRRVPRGNVKPPCWDCPKQSPEEAHKYELSDKNAQAVHFYYVTRAMAGANLTDDMRYDAILQKNMGIIDRIIRGAEGEQSAMATIAPLMQALSMVKGR